MTTQDIEIGAIYHLNPCPIEMFGVYFLGCGMRKLFTVDEFESKHLVVIDPKNLSKNTGLLLQEGANAGNGIWECLEKLEGETINSILK